MVLWRRFARTNGGRGGYYSGRFLPMLGCWLFCVGLTVHLPVVVLSQTNTSVGSLFFDLNGTVFRRDTSSYCGEKEEAYRIDLRYLKNAAWHIWLDTLTVDGVTFVDTTADVYFRLRGSCFEAWTAGFEADSPMNVMFLAAKDLFPGRPVDTLRIAFAGRRNPGTYERRASGDEKSLLLENAIGPAEQGFTVFLDGDPPQLQHCTLYLSGLDRTCRTALFDSSRHALWWPASLDSANLVCEFSDAGAGAIDSLILYRLADRTALKGTNLRGGLEWRIRLDRVVEPWNNGEYSFCINARDTAYSPTLAMGVGQYEHGGNWRFPDVSMLRPDTLLLDLSGEVLRIGRLVIDREPTLIDSASFQLMPRDSGRILAKIHFGSLWRTNRWWLRGIWRAAFARGAKDVDYFKAERCKRFFVKDSAAVVVSDVVTKGDTLTKTFAGFDPGDLVRFSVAFLDSSGLVSRSLIASTYYPLRLSFHLVDPTLDFCQDVDWSNDQDSITVVFNPSTDREYIDSIVVRFSWTDGTESKAFEHGLPSQITLPLPHKEEIPPCDPSWITIWGYRTETGAKSQAYTSSIHFDFDEPLVDSSFLVFEGESASVCACKPLPGYTARPQVRVHLGGVGYSDLCGEAPTRIALYVDADTLQDSCAASRDGVNTLPAVEGEYVLIAAAWDSAGNSSTASRKVVYDRTPASVALISFELRDRETDRSQEANGDTVRAVLGIRAPTRVDSTWYYRGIYAVAFLPGRHEEICGDSVLWQPIGESADSTWLVSGKMDSLNRLWVTVFLRDSSGVISEPIQDSIQIPLEFGLKDPQLVVCQDSSAWSNDPDSLTVQVYGTQALLRRIDSVRVSYGWLQAGKPIGASEDSDWFRGFLTGLPVSFSIPLPPERTESCVWDTVYIRFHLRGTRQWLSNWDAIKFDFERPLIDRGAVKFVDPSPANGKSCVALPGWAHQCSLKVLKDNLRFHDNCAEHFPLAFRIDGDVMQVDTVCWANVESVLLAGPPGESGKKVVRVSVLDQAGNLSSNVDHVTVLYDVTPVDSDVVTLWMSDIDSACENPFPELPKLSRCDRVRICGKFLTDWAPSDWRVRGVRDVAVVEGWVDSVSCANFDSLNSFAVPSPMISQRFSFVVRLSASTQRQCAQGDSLRLTVFFRDSSGVLSDGFHLLGVPLPSVSGYVFSPSKPSNHRYLGLDEIDGNHIQIGVAVEISRISESDTVSVRIMHPCRLDTCGVHEEIVLDTTVVGRTTFHVSPRRISARRLAAYVDSVILFTEVDGGHLTARKVIHFVVDRSRPEVGAFRVVRAEGQVSPSIQSSKESEIWLYLAVRDSVAGKQFWPFFRENVQWRHLYLTGVKDSMEVLLDVESLQTIGARSSFSIGGVAEFENWVRIDLGQTGWWVVSCTVEDSAGWLVQDTLRVDYNPDSTQAFCYPNPFRPSVDENVCFHVYSQEEGTGELAIYDAFGFVVFRRKGLHFESGVNDGCNAVAGLTWDGRNEKGDVVGSGGYICWISTPDGKTHLIKVGVLR